MSEETKTTGNSRTVIGHITAVLDKEKMKIQAVKSIDENGKMETVDPTKKTNQFMRVDKHGDFFPTSSPTFGQLKTRPIFHSSKYAPMPSKKQTIAEAGR
jgi:hypothetical protein